MSESRAEVEAKGYMRITTLNKLMLFVLNLSIWGSYLMGYTSTIETCGLFFIAVLITGTLLKLTINRVKHDAIGTGYIPEGSSVFDILNKFSEDLRNCNPAQRMDYRKKNSLLSTRFDATATLIVHFLCAFVFWAIFVVKVLF